MTISFTDALKIAKGLDVQISNNDDRYQKVQESAEQFSENLDPNLLFDGCYSLVRESFFDSNKALQAAFNILQENWPNIDVVYTEKPNRLLTSIVLFAFINSAQKNDSLASRLALLLTDVLPYIEEKNLHQLISKNEIQQWVEQLNKTSYSSYVNNLKISNLKNKNFKSDDFINEGETVFSLEKNVSVLNNTFKDLNLSLNKNYEDISSTINYQNEKIDTLWWYESKFSKIYLKSYREINIFILPLIMSFELLDLMKGYPAPLSSTYILAESISQIKDADYEKKYNLLDILTKIREEKDFLKENEIFSKTILLENSYLNIRDLVILAFKTNEDLNVLINKCIVNIDEISLPNLAKAIYRQEQVYRLGE